MHVKNVDILQYVSAFYRRSYAGGYLQLTNRTPLLWGYFYKSMDFAKAAKRQARIIETYDAIQFKKFREMVREYDPHHVISTHFLPLQIFAPYRRKGEITWPYAATLTDFDAHVIWAQFTCDRFFVATDEVGAVMQGKGIEPEKLQTVGIPISPAFSKTYDRAKIRETLGLRDNPPTLLVMGGGHGQGGLLDTVTTALSAAPVQVLAVAGKNEKIRKSIETVKVPEGRTLKVFGYVNNIHELMAASDLVISKSGGLTLAECLAMGLPMLLPDPVPGQEERNCNYVMECGAALYSHGAGSLKYKLKLLLEDHDLRNRMAANAKAHGKPNAARDVIRAVVAMGKTVETTK